MSKSVIATTSAPAAIGPYSQAVKVGDLVFCSGQLGLDPATGEFAPGGVRAQAEQAMKNLEALAKAAGCSLDGIVKTTIFLKDMADFPVVNEVYGARFKGDKPARSTVAVAGLPKGGLVEIEAILSL
ncbi:MAG TPA: RidA family protein [Spirochaetales bacterium]|nr:RidA family protein [Spirochaetales bacterium]HPM72518.1 RidA family protein [Spirochaetales bacterium]